MTPPKRERIPSYLQDVIDCQVTILKYLESASRDAIIDEEDDRPEINLLRDGLVRRLEVVGQALDNIKKADPDYVATTKLDVSGWYSLRAKISHGYETVDYVLLLGVIDGELPSLVEKVEGLLAEFDKK